MELDTRNKAPVFDLDEDEDGDRDTMVTRKVEENTEAVAADDALPESENVADNVGAAVTAIDTKADGSDETLTYSLGGADAAKFRVRDNGQIEVAAGTKLNYETKSTYMVTVMARDPLGASASIPVTIMVTNVDEAPEIMMAPDANVAPEFADSEDGARSVAENTVAGEDIGNPVAASDANRDTLAYTLGGTDAASFDIDTGSGQLMTLAALDYEIKNAYTVTVTADDGNDGHADVTVTINVTNVEEAGTVTLSSMTPMVGTELTATLSDPDDSVTGETWQWSKSDAVDGTFADIAGATSSSYTPVEGDASMYLRATAMYTDGEGSGKNAMATTGSAVTAAPSGDPLVAKYDANNNGKIDKPEVIAAIRDYVRDGTISKADVIKLIRMYIRGD